MYYLGVDIGGTNIAVGIVDSEGRIVLKDSVPTLSHRDGEEIFADIADLCLKLLAEYGITVADVQSIGAGTPGTVDRENAVIIYANNLSCRNAPIGASLRKKIDLPVYLENDANCAALGESVSGAEKGYKNSMTVTLGTGVGGGIILDGKIFTGAYGGGGEIGHHVIVVNGRACTCGRKGCWESYVSSTGLVKQAKSAVEKHPGSKIVALAGSMDQIEAKTVFDAYDAGDALAKELVDEYIYYLAEGMANMVNIFDPEIIVLGGGIAMRGDKLIAPLMVEMGKSVYAGAGPGIQVVRAVLGNDAGIIGAAMLGEQ